MPRGSPGNVSSSLSKTSIPDKLTGECSGNREKYSGSMTLETGMARGVGTGGRIDVSLASLLFVLHRMTDSFIHPPPNRVSSFDLQGTS